MYEILLYVPENLVDRNKSMRCSIARGMTADFALLLTSSGLPSTLVLMEGLQSFAFKIFSIPSIFFIS